MLSLREVHLIDTSAARIPPFGPIYVPPLLLPFEDNSSSPSSGNPSSGTTVSPTQDSASLFFVAECDTSIVAGNVVFAGMGDTVILADNTSPQPVIGIVTSKKSPTLAVVQTSGQVVLGLNNLSPGVDYFLGTQGALITTPLTGVMFVQKVGTATTGTSLFLALDGHVIRQNNG